ncbi:MAG: ABC transporter permease [Desulfatiglandales bacterium]
MKWIERQRHFLDFTLSSLWRRKGRNLSLLLVYTFVVFLVSSVIFFAGAIRYEAVALLDDAPEMVVQRTVAGRYALMPVDYLEKIRTIRGIQASERRLWGYYYHPASRSNYTLMVPRDFPHEDDAAEIGQGVLRTWGTSQGNRLYFKTYDGDNVILRVVKTFSASTELVSSDLILVSENTFHKIFGYPEGFVTDLALEIRNQKECQTIAEKIVLMLPDTRPLLKEEILRTYTSLFDWRSGYIIVLLAGAVLAFFIFAWDKATGLSAEEKSEIGILKAVGWDTSDILIMKFWEGMALSLTAFIIGVLSAYVHVFFTSATLFEHALKGWAVLYPDFELTPVVDAFHLVVLFSLTVIPYTFITVVPTWRVSSMDPDIVMRQG